jgi:hypothetical protein
VHVEHDRNATARERPPHQYERRLVRSLDEHDRRPEPAKLARDAPRQQRVERNAVERAHRKRAHEREDVIAARRAGRRAREHAEVGDVRERGELAPAALVERQPVARPTDEQEARLHARAARSRICSSRS